MKRRLKDAIKERLTRVGAGLSHPGVQRIQAIASYIGLGRWMADHGFHFEHRVADIESIFDAVARRVPDGRMLYLEFGVFQGASIRYWSRKIKDPRAVFHGFDSFEGLPEDGGSWDKGEFDVGGRIPSIDDPRVRFFKGWFDQVLPTYSLPEHDVLIINLDADLYASTICVLRHLRPYIKPGTFIYFDELDQLEHEPRAFHHFLSETGLKFKPVCAHFSLAHAAFECVG